MTRRALVIARHRREVVIEAEDGSQLGGLVRGRDLKPLAGDEILWSLESDGTPVIEELLPRRNVLERIDGRGQAEGVAANLSLLVVVLAPQPKPDWQLVDHYLAGAATIGADAALVRNKQDVEDRELDRRVVDYRPLACAVVHTSVKQHSGIDELADVLADRRGVLVGQSGVGKSSLLNALLGSDAQVVGSLSERRALGRHTTTSSVLHRLPNGGEIIDSPGVRRYAPYIANPADLDSGFIEFRPYLGHCRFNDCRHTHEPGCAILAALGEGKISAARYQNYVALRTTLDSLRKD